jgi:hypothetical protein
MAPTQTNGTGPRDHYGGIPRFELELEVSAQSNVVLSKSQTDTRTRHLQFVQLLANPDYVHFLATQKVLEEPEFVEYIRYLEYFRKPDYVKYLQ